MSNDLDKAKAKVKALEATAKKTADATLAKVEKAAAAMLKLYVKSGALTAVTFRPDGTYHITGTSGGGSKSASPIKAWGAVDIEVTTGSGKSRKTRRLGHTQVSKVLAMVGIDYGKNSPMREAIKPLVEPKVAAIRPTLIAKDGRKADMLEVIKADA